MQCFKIWRHYFCWYPLPTSKSSRYVLSWVQENPTLRSLSDDCGDKLIIPFYNLYAAVCTTSVLWSKQLVFCGKRKINCSICRSKLIEVDLGINYDFKIFRVKFLILMKWAILIYTMKKYQVWLLLCLSKRKIIAALLWQFKRAAKRPV